MLFLERLTLSHETKAATFTLAVRKTIQFHHNSSRKLLLDFSLEQK